MSGNPYDRRNLNATSRQDRPFINSNAGRSQYPPRRPMPKRKPLTKAEQSVLTKNYKLSAHNVNRYQNQLYLKNQQNPNLRSKQEDCMSGENAVIDGRSLVMKEVMKSDDGRVGNAFFVPQAIQSQLEEQYSEKIEGNSDDSKVLVDHKESSIKVRFDGGIMDTYVHLDSSFKSADFTQLEIGRISFDVRAINRNKPIENVIMMEISEFYIPDIVPEPLVAGALGRPDFFFYRRATIQIEELTTQPVETGDNRQFHFEFEVIPAGPSVLLRPLNNRFVFKTPFISIERLTLRFGAPFRNIPLFEETFTGTITSYSPGANPNSMEITTDFPHSLDIGTVYTVYISGVDTTLKSMNDYLNDDVGHLTVPPYQQSSFFIQDVILANVDPLSVGTSPVGQRITVVIGVRRMFIPMRFRTLTTEQTNQIIPV